MGCGGKAAFARRAPAGPGAAGCLAVAQRRAAAELSR